MGPAVANAFGLYKVRNGRPEDGPELERLRLARPYPGSFFYDSEAWYAAALARLRESLPLLAEHPELRLLVIEGTAFLLFALDHRHGVTQQAQGMVLDYAVPGFEALEALVKRARKLVTAFENEYLVVDLPARDQRTQLWFYRCGFRAEQNRAVKRLPLGFAGASSPAWPLRRAAAEDLPFVLETHAAWTAAYRPAGRDTDLQSLEFHYQLTYAGLDLENEICYILEEADTRRRAGYIFIKAGTHGTERSYYVYDVGLARAFEGRGLSRYLIGCAETLAGSEGALLYGDASLATPLLANWHAQMGYTVDSVRFALDCRPDRSC